MSCAQPARYAAMSDQQGNAGTPPVVARELQKIVSALLHALAGPLQTIDGFSLILQEDYSDRPLDLEGWEHLQRIRNDAARMRMLLDDLSHYLQILTAEADLEWVDASALAQEIAHRLKRDEPERDVQWQIEPGIMVYADQSLLRQALEQLLQNAWKFSRDRTPACIEIGTSGPARQELFVRDNGVGFNPKYSNNLFIPFKRLHHHTEFAGTGMGLSIVQEIMRRHHGTVVAASAPGSGATFTLHFPAS